MKPKNQKRAEAFVRQLKMEHDKKLHDNKYETPANIWNAMRNTFVALPPHMREDIILKHACTEFVK